MKGKNQKIYTKKISRFSSEQSIRYGTGAEKIALGEKFFKFAHFVGDFKILTKFYRFSEKE